jgi:hypothetical protein
MPPPFGAALTLTDPFPLPDAAPTIVSQLGSPLAALQLHQLPVVTATVAVPPPAATD